jgi:hypothetical protein
MIIDEKEAHKQSRIDLLGSYGGDWSRVYMFVSFQ